MKWSRRGKARHDFCQNSIQCCFIVSLFSVPHTTPFLRLSYLNMKYCMCHSLAQRPCGKSMSEQWNGFVRALPLQSPVVTVVCNSWCLHWHNHLPGLSFSIQRLLVLTIWTWLWWAGGIGRVGFHWLLERVKRIDAKSPFSCVQIRAKTD